MTKSRTRSKTWSLERLNVMKTTHEQKLEEAEETLRKLQNEVAKYNIKDPNDIDYKLGTKQYPEGFLEADRKVRDARRQVLHSISLVKGIEKDIFRKLQDEAYQERISKAREELATRSKKVTGPEAHDLMAYKPTLVLMKKKIAESGLQINFPRASEALNKIEAFYGGARTPSALISAAIFLSDPLISPENTLALSGTSFPTMRRTVDELLESGAFEEPDKDKESDSDERLAVVECRAFWKTCGALTKDLVEEDLPKDAERVEKCARVCKINLIK